MTKVLDQLAKFDLYMGMALRSITGLKTVKVTTVIDLAEYEEIAADETSTTAAEEVHPDSISA